MTDAISNATKERDTSLLLEWYDLYISARDYANYKLTKARKELNNSYRIMKVYQADKKSSNDELTMRKFTVSSKYYDVSRFTDELNELEEIIQMLESALMSL